MANVFSFETLLNEHSTWKIGAVKCNTTQCKAGQISKDQNIAVQSTAGKGCF